jgi:hypothetical protein
MNTHANSIPAVGLAYHPVDANQKGVDKHIN